MKFNHLLTASAVFTAMAATAQAPQPKMYKWLPVYGDLEDKTCPGVFTKAPTRPGQFLGMGSPLFKDKPDLVFEMIMGNDCKPRTFRIDKATGEPVEIASTVKWIASMKRRPLAGLAPLQGEWWREPALLSPVEQPVIASYVEAQPFAVCRTRIGSQLVIDLPSDTIVLSDRFNAHYIKTTLTNTCEVIPLVSISQPALASLSGGGRLNPGNIEVNPPSKATPATVPLIVVGYYAMPTALMGLTWLGLNQEALSNAYRLDGAVALPQFMDGLVATLNILGLPPHDMGEFSLILKNTPPPTATEAEAGIARNNPDKASALAKQLSELISADGARRGSCKDPSEFDKYNGAVKAACYPNGVSLLGCNSLTDPVVAAARAQQHKACAEAREQRDGWCFDKGDEGHRTQTRQAWRAMQNCLSVIK